ncbi:hypothetical protein TSMEX_004086 [Taenia solium]|eukprot:TsM_001106400 transcript=TsM_001106400 gene=TsM_001106400
MEREELGAVGMARFRLADWYKMATKSTEIGSSNKQSITCIGSSGTRIYGEASDVGDYPPPPYKPQDSAFSNRDTNEVSPSDENFIVQKEIATVSKVPLAQPVSDLTPSPKEKPQVVASTTKTTSYYSPQFQTLWSRNITPKTPLLEKVGPKPVVKPNVRAQKEDYFSAGRRSFDQLDRKSVAIEPNAHVGEERENARIATMPVRGSRENYFGRNENYHRSSSRGRYPNQFQQESSTIPRVPLRNEENAAKEEMRFESEGNRVSSRSSSSDQERVPHPSANDSNEESGLRGAVPIMPWYYQHLEQGTLWRQRIPEAQESGRSSSNGTKAKVVPTTPSILPPPRDERSVSRDGSLSSISPFRPYDDNVSNGNLRPLSPAAKPHRSRSPSETSDVAAVDVRERVIEIQQRSAAASLSVATKQHFPPLSLIPQLRQQKSESTVDWLDRLKGQLKQYMEPSCREYDVILRWILSCGSRHEGGYAAISLQMSVEDLVNRLTVRDTINDSRGVLPTQPLRDSYFNSNKMNLYGASSVKTKPAYMAT